MASSYQQQALMRKFVYAGLIVALFTVSLLHRRLIVEPQGDRLQLREVSQGQVQLADAVVRRVLTGSRGMTVTFLWYLALEKQKRHEWNELDLYVSSITKLQPHFITPWLFQSWNLAFNVAVECDRPRDKYFYISRGIEMLAEGERRNFKPPAPGNPDMRQNMGLYYQSKIGNSDEKETMRCLLEMSCIDPLERAPERFWGPSDDRGKKVKLDKFKEFCIQHPRVVRRLNEQLKLATPEDIVLFLEENRDIPSRFEPPTEANQKECLVKDELDQFPVMPPGRPQPKSRELSTDEVVDVFYVCRSWYEYSVQPLPEPSPDPSEDRAPPNPMEKRMPRAIAAIIFRSGPARGQAYIAENLEAEGWFDADGWIIRKWFDKERGPNDPEVRAGTEPKYYAGPSWEAAYRRYLDYGIRNGLYLTPSEVAEIQKAANIYREKYDVKEGIYGRKVYPDAGKTEIWERILANKEPIDDMPPDEKESFLLWKGYRAHNRLIRTAVDDSMSNFYDWLTQSDGERAPETVAARKFFYNARRFRYAQDPERAIPLFEKGWELWTQVLLGHPKFARLDRIQEDLYEAQLVSNRYTQENRAPEFRKTLLGLAQFAIWPHPPLENILKLNAAEWTKIVPVRSSQGITEYLAYYDGPGAAELKLALAGWTSGTVPGMHVPTPAQIDTQLTQPISRDNPLPKDWRTFADEGAIQRVRIRFGLDRQERKEKK